MLNKIEMKQWLLQDSDFIDNEYLDHYLDLVLKNYKFKSTDYTEKHHIKPVACYKKYYNCKTRQEGLKYADTDPNNAVVSLLYRDHCKAHWLLFFCTTGKLRAGSAACLLFMFNVCRSIKDVIRLNDEDFSKIQNYINTVVNSSINRYWSSNDIQFLYNNYPKYGQRYCAEKLNKSITAVSHKANRLWLKMNKWWSDQEEQFLIDNWLKLGVAVCANTLNRSEKAIIGKVSALKLTNQNIYTVDQLTFLKANYTIYGPRYCAKHLNRTYEAVRRKATHLGLKCPQEVPIYCLELDREFKSITAAAKELNISNGNICSVLHGRAETTNGYHFIKISREEYYNEKRKS